MTLNIPLNQGVYSGLAIWARSLVARIEKLKAHIDRLWFVDEKVKRPAIEKYDSIYGTFRLFINSCLKTWEAEVNMEDPSVLEVKCLAKSLLIRPDENHPEVMKKES